MKNKLVIHFSLLMAIGIFLPVLAMRLYPECFTCKKPAGSFDLKKALLQDAIVPIAIIGSGPAGLSAAIYGARSNVKTVILEGDKPGGLLTETTEVENWPGIPSAMGPEIMEQVKKQAEQFGAVFLADSVEKVDFSQWPFVLKTEDGRTLHALTVIVATGANPKTLDIPGEQEYWGKGVSTCAVCDARFYKDEEVLVIGGGDSAAEEAMQLAPYAKSVTLMVRKNKMRAAGRMQDLLKNVKNITVQYNIEVKEVKGDGKHVTAVKVLNNLTNKTSDMPIKGVFFAIGHIPNSSLVSGSIKTDASGYIQLEGRSQKTSMPGVFAAGDVEDHVYRQAGVASGSGIKASLDAFNFLMELGYNAEFEKKLQEQGKLFSLKKKRVEKVVQSLDSIQAFEKVIAQSKPVVIDFWAEYCPSCLQMIPVFEDVASEFSDSMHFYKVDIGQKAFEPLMKKYKIEAIPLILIFKDGKVSARQAKAMTRSELREFLQAS